MSSYRGSRIIFSEVIGKEDAPVGVKLTTEKEVIELYPSFGALEVTAKPREARKPAREQRPLGQGAIKHALDNAAPMRDTGAMNKGQFTPPTASE
jgi:hypothetical protein